MSPMFKVNRPLLYQEVVDALYKIIDSQQIQPGNQLPSERELIEQLGVSRNVLREAFHVLEQRGVVVSRQGKGRFLRELPKNRARSDKYELISKNLEHCTIYEVYEVRQALEVKAMSLVVQNASDEDLQEIEDAYQALMHSFRLKQDTAGEFNLHRLYARKTGNVFLEQMMEIILQAHWEMMNTTQLEVRNQHNTETETIQHRAILDALWARDEKAARQAMFDHIQTSLDIFRK